MDQQHLRPLGVTRYRAALLEAGRACIEAALEESGGNRSKAARLLGVRRTHLYQLAHRHGVKISRERSHRQLEP